MKVKKWFLTSNHKINRRIIMETKTNDKVKSDYKNDPFFQNMMEKNDNRTRLIESQNPYENKEMFLNDVKRYMTIENTLFDATDIRDEHDDDFLNPENAEYLVLCLHSREGLIERLNDVISLAKLKTLIKRQWGELKYPERVRTSDVLLDILEGEIDCAGALEEERERTLDDYFNEIKQNCGDGADEFEHVDSIRMDLDRKYENNDFILESSDWDYVYRTFEEREKIDRERKNED